MNAAELRNAFRLDTDDSVAPYFWSESEVATYADEAQTMFARLTRGIRDASSALCFLDISPGEDFVDIDPRILVIERVQRDSDAHRLQIVNFEDLDTAGIRLDRTVGAVDTVVVGMEPHKLRWLRIPKVADTASLVIGRLPLRTITATSAAALEIDAQHHRALLLYMQALAYGKQDADTRDENKAALKDAQFRAYCAQALIEKNRARHKSRAVIYGGL